jgi:hypothetical protein
MPAIDADRLLADLRELRRFGATGTGVVRTSLSPIDLEARPIFFYFIYALTLTFICPPCLFNVPLPAF